MLDNRMQRSYNYAVKIHLTHTVTMKKISTEQMRYSVPKVKNRFLQVHGKLIALCAVICLLAITVSLCFVTVRQAYTLEPKNNLIFYGTVENEEEARALIRKYFDRIHIVLFMYEDNAGKSELVNSYGSTVSYYYTKNRFSSDEYYIAAVFGRNGTKGKVYTVSNKDKALMDAESFEKLINKVLDDL